MIEEIREYHRKQMPNGTSQIVKIKDDLISAVRYAFMMARHAIQKADTLDKDVDEYYDDAPQPNSACGY